MNFGTLPGALMNSRTGGYRGRHQLEAGAFGAARCRTPTICIVDGAY